MFLEILQEVWPIGFGAITSVFYFKIDSLILPYYYNPATHPDLGYYATAYKLFEVALVFGGFYTNTLFPFLSAQLSRKNFLTICRKFFLYTCGIAFLASIILFVFARLFIYVLGGVKYFPAIPSLEILSLGAFVSILSGFFLSLAVAGRKQVLVLYFSIAAAILNILLNLVFIPKFSFIGASWTTVVTQAFILITNAIAALLVVRQAQSGKIRPHV